MTVNSRNGWYRIVGAVLGLVVVMGLTPSSTDPFDQGVQAYKQGEFQRAKSIFRTVFEQRPDYVDERYGSTAYWLGRAYRACEQPDSMRWAWREGIEALNSAGRFDARLFDEYLWAAWGAEEDEGKAAAEAYEDLLRRVGSNMGEDERPILLRHVAQLLPLLDEKQRIRKLAEGSSSSPSDWTFRKGAGDWLVAWWTRQDPVPATEGNERLREHLDRVVVARQKYANNRRISGWDARGDLYVRYGPPFRRDSISFSGARFHREVIRFGVGVHRGDFPANEIWSYPRVGPRGHYLFVETDGAFQLGQTLDLLPPKLKGNFHSADRSQNRAYSSMAALRYIYEQLAMHYTDAGHVYENLEAYFTNQDILKDAFGGNMSVGYGSSEREVYRGPGASSSQPSAVASQALLTSRHQQRVFVRKREQEMPIQYSEVGSAETVLPVQVRTARFLTEDGSTRAEVYWGGNIGQGDLESDRQRIDISVVRYGSGYSRENVDSEQYQFEVREEGALDRHKVSEPLEAIGRTDPFHLAIQWDRRELWGDDGEMEVGDRTARRTIWIDSLRALRSDPAHLEMSDLRPMIASPGEQFGRENSVEKAEPFPFSTLSAESPLVLYFEVYHLAVDDQGRTEYKVSYAVERTVKDDGFLGLFGGEDTKRTETSSTYGGKSSKTSEFIQLDWGDVTVEKSQPVTVTVQVEDQRTGQQVERTTELTLVSPDHIQ